MAFQLFSVCNNRANDDWNKHFFEFYKKCQNDPDATHLGKYINIKEKKNIKQVQSTTVLLKM
jgi:hypothetical protein